MPDLRIDLSQPVEYVPSFGVSNIARIRATWALQEMLPHKWQRQFLVRTDQKSDSSVTTGVRDCEWTMLKRW